MLVLLLDCSAATAVGRVHVCVRAGKIIENVPTKCPRDGAGRKSWPDRLEIGRTEQILLAISRAPPSPPSAGLPRGSPRHTHSRKLVAEKEQFSRLPTSYRQALLRYSRNSVYDSGEAGRGVSQGAARHPATNRSGFVLFRPAKPRLATPRMWRAWLIAPNRSLIGNILAIDSSCVIISAVN